MLYRNYTTQYLYSIVLTTKTIFLVAFFSVQDSGQEVTFFIYFLAHGIIERTDQFSEKHFQTY